MSSTRQAVILSPSFTGLGKRPVLTPAHQVDLLTGIGPRGAMMEGSRTKPVDGSSVLFSTVSPHLIECEVVLRWLIAFVTEVGLDLTDFGFSLSVR